MNMPSLAKGQTFFVTEVPKICATLVQPPVPIDLESRLEELGITTYFEESGSVSVDVLIGLYHWKFMGPKIAFVSDGLCAQEKDPVLSGFEESVK